MDDGETLVVGVGVAILLLLTDTVGVAVIVLVGVTVGVGVDETPGTSYTIDISGLSLPCKLKPL